ncbi:MAG: hypothetical protein OEZ22_05745 [Spirochaetia bacterium]|nr:hypothetical protein [Spirochaetia bacterium]
MKKYLMILLMLCISTMSYQCNNNKAVCGDGIVEDYEECDGTPNCKPDCFINLDSDPNSGYCGDNTLNGTETCDDGNTTTETCAYGETSCTVCDSTCNSVAGTVSYCGDNTLNGTETCDDGNTTTETECPYGTPTCDTCNSDCSATLSLTGVYCGDGICNEGEGENNGSCGSDCPIVCGDSRIEGTEACDDGNTTTETCAYGEASCTVCDSTCNSVAGVVIGYCGDGICNEGENNGSCSPDCPIVCGDSRIEGTEACDDGNTTTETCAYGETSCTVCDSTCNSVAGTVSYCGDNIVQANEACDDGNTTTETCAYGETSCTVCDSTCNSVAGTVSYCGDNIVQANEACDDGNTTTETECPYGTPTCDTCNSDCSATLSLTGEYCGDSICTGYETSANCPSDCISAGDTTPPELISVSLNGTPMGPTGKYTYGDTITISAGVNDGASGIAYLALSLNNSNGELLGNCTANYLSNNIFECVVTIINHVGNTLTGDAYAIVYTVDNNSNLEEYILDSILSTSNYTKSSSNTISSVPIIYVPIEEFGSPVCGDSVCAGYETSANCPGDCISAGDTTPPEFSNINVSGTPTGPNGKYTYGDTITINVDVTDAGSGVKTVTLVLYNSISNFLGPCSSVNYISGNTFRCSITITQDFTTIIGDGFLSIDLQDYNNNSNSYSHIADVPME